MINLYNYIRESLLDDEEEIDNNFDLEMVKKWLNDPGGEFLKKLKHTSDGDNHIDGEILYLSTPNRCRDIYVKTASLPDLPIFEKYNINGLAKPNVKLCGNVISPKYIFKNIYSNFITLDCDKVEDMNLNVSFTMPDGSKIREYEYGVNFLANSIVNTKVDFQFPNNRAIDKLDIYFNKYHEHLDLDTNARNIVFSNALLFEPNMKIMGVLDKLILKGHVFDYDDKSQKKEVVINKFKKLYSIINNPNKYFWSHSGACNFIITSSPRMTTLKKLPINSDFDISKEFPWTKKMKNLRSIRFTDSLITVHFLKENILPIEGVPINNGWYAYIYH